MGTLKKNTESIGTLFDPLPTQLTGNIQCINNPSEPVIGYIGAYSIEEKRIFISKKELPENWKTITGYENCTRLDTVDNTPEDIAAQFGAEGSIPVYELLSQRGPGVIGYLYSTKTCIDCRVRGTNVRPAFWE